MFCYASILLVGNSFSQISSTHTYGYGAIHQSWEIYEASHIQNIKESDSPSLTAINHQWVFCNEWGVASMSLLYMLGCWLDWASVGLVQVATAAVSSFLPQPHHVQKSPHHRGAPGILRWHSSCLLLRNVLPPPGISRKISQSIRPEM